jgi:hypothetical protein
MKKTTPRGSPVSPFPALSRARSTTLPWLAAFIDRHCRVKPIEVIEKAKGMHASVLWPGMEFDALDIRHLSHVAVGFGVG